MNPRGEFLSALFRILEEKAVPYCVQRNYENIFAESDSDVDLAVEPEHFDSLTEGLKQAAIATNFRLIQSARYVNYSYVFLRAGEPASVLRVDVETEIRWRCFPLLSTKAMIGLRRKQNGFYIPHPRHESIILFGAAIWRSHLSERYREQLARLYQAENPEAFRRSLRSAFGSAGDDLARLQSSFVTGPSTLDTPHSAPWKAAKRSLLVNAFRDRPNRRALARYFIADARRFWHRLLHPAGISLIDFSTPQQTRFSRELRQRLELLYPAQKSSVDVVEREVATAEDGVAPLTIHRPPSILERERTLFKGGLFLRYHPLRDNAYVNKMTARFARGLFPARAFVLLKTSSDIFLAHVSSGFMAEFKAGEGQAAADQIIEFISEMSERRKATEKLRGKRGLFVVLVGLDGSGKTTVARKLCGLGAIWEQFAEVRYFHWLPRLTNLVEFPLPDVKPTPRKSKLEPTFLRSAVSVLRLLKNIVRANLAYWLELDRRLSGNALILTDRYYYNYFLDPVSVRYYGPGWVLNWARKFFPKPDVVVVFKTASEILRSRKPELSEEEIQRQNQLLHALDFRARNSFDVDASLPIDEVAAAVMTGILKIANE